VKLRISFANRSVSLNSRAERSLLACCLIVARMSVSSISSVNPVQAVQWFGKLRLQLPLVPSINSGRALSSVEGYAPFEAVTAQRKTRFRQRKYVTAGSRLVY
jgi:hypothetical protein